MKILLPTDGSEYSEGAAKFLGRFNLQKEDEIIILYALNYVPIVTELESFYVDFKEIKDTVVPRVIDSTSKILKTVKAKISSRFVEDFPDKAIVDTAVSEHADIIIMGARGLKGISSYVVGSTTRSVAIKSHTPVFIIKPSQWEPSEKLKILFAADGSKYSDAMSKTLSAIPFPDSVEVTILNVVFPAFSDIPERFYLEINDRIKKIAADAREKEHAESEKTIKNVRKSLTGKFSKIDEMTIFGEPSKEILEAAEKIKADVIAVGSSGMRGIKGMIGSVSRYVLNHSRCSVLVGKD